MPKVATILSIVSLCLSSYVIYRNWKKVVLGRVRMKVVNRRDLVNLLLKNSFKYVRTRGGHYIYKRGEDTAVVSIRQNEVITARMIKEYNLV